MRLNDTEFGHVFCASGARNFLGQGWAFHGPLSTVGLLDYTNSTLVSKTMTLNGRPGFMALKAGDHYKPRHLFPDCVIVKWADETVLNAVGLTNPGAEQVLSDLALRCMDDPKPVILSFASVEKNRSERISETGLFARHLSSAVKGKFNPAVSLALQLNISCPNTGHDQLELMSECGDQLDILATVGIPILVKINALVTPSTAVTISTHNACQGIVCSNSIPWDAVPGDERQRVFHSTTSPLQQYGGGGWSGRYLQELVPDWIRRTREKGMKKPIIACGGILSHGDADTVIDAGASAVELGCVSILRPWRVQGIIKHVNNRLNGDNGGRS